MKNIPKQLEKAVFDKEAAQISASQRATIVRAQGASSEAEICCETDAVKNRFFKLFRYKLCLLFVPFLLYYLGNFCLKMTDGFSIARITSTFPEGIPAWDDSAREKSVELHTALEQTYHYLGAGGQCFAFVSEDKRYV